jgi:hypothetical protein
MQDAEISLMSKLELSMQKAMFLKHLSTLKIAKKSLVFLLILILYFKATTT